MKMKVEVEAKLDKITVTETLELEDEKQLKELNNLFNAVFLTVHSNSHVIDEKIREYINFTPSLMEAFNSKSEEDCFKEMIELCKVFENTEKNASKYANYEFQSIEAKN